ncbi:MAG: hypothetical protein LBD15_02590 [Holosporales bacterium]|nr:hypothetical protein [Holosporales bacterium]
MTREFVRIFTNSSNIAFLLSVFAELNFSPETIDRYRERIECVTLDQANAAAIKVYPALFGLLHLPQKRYKDAFLSTFFTLILVFVLFFFFEKPFL